MDREKGKSKEGLPSFYKAVLTLQTEEECRMFFDDVCTIAELHALGQRMEVARMLNNDKTYQEISQETGASTATISRVNRCLLYGDGGYRLVLDRMEKKKK